MCNLGEGSGFLAEGSARAKSLGRGRARAFRELQVVLLEWSEKRAWGKGGHNQ